MKEYERFLQTKLFLIECKARRAVLNGDKSCQDILNIVMASPSEIEERLNKHEF